MMTRFYAFCMLLYVLAVYDVTWLDFLSYSSPIRFFIIVVSIMKIMGSRRTLQNSRMAPIVFLLLYCLYCIIATLGSFYLSINYLSLFVSMTSIIMLNVEEKKYLLDLFTKAFVVIMVISLIGWIPYLLGVNLPHTSLIYHRNDFHEYYDYYLFRVSYVSSIGFFPRFQSIFLEPGQMATPCMFLFFLNAMEGNVFSFKNIVLLLSILLSFSLIAYGLLVFSLVVIPWFKGKKFRLPLTIGVVGAIVGATFFFLSNEDSVVNTLILSRLGYDDESLITGNNRTSGEFDLMFDSFMRSGDKFFGIRNKLISGNDWTTNSSGLKKFIVHFGLVGLSLGMLMILSLYRKNKNKKTLAFLVILVTAFVVRNLLFGALWLSIAILGFSTLGLDAEQQVLQLRGSRRKRPRPRYMTGAISNVVVS